jgi:hypothetical protein
VKPSRIHCVYIPGRKKLLKLACSTSTVRRDDTMMMMMMALTNHTNHSKHTQKPTQKNTHNPLTHSLTHSRSHSKTTLGNFAQNSVLQRFFRTSKQRNCKCVHTRIFENDDGKNCLLSDHICTQEKAEFLEENDERKTSRSSSGRERMSVRGRRGAAHQVSHTRGGWGPSARQPRVSAGYFAFILITSGYYFRVASFFRPATPVIKPPVFLVSG